MAKRRIYLDNAAITPVDPAVLKEMVAYSGILYGNPSSIHAEGVLANRALAEGRKMTAEFLHGHSDEVVFTASGTEANNLAIEGVVAKFLEQGKTIADVHIVTSVVEHSSILECTGNLLRRGAQIDYVSVDGSGVVNLEELKEKITPNTLLVSIQYVNNEVGTIQPLYEIAKTIRHVRKGNVYPLFHVDASQAPLYVPLDTRSLGADLVTIDGQKIYGPHGIGALWVRRQAPIAPVVRGGGQERGIRSGTENVPAIMGLALALKQAELLRKKEVKRLTLLRDYFIKSLVKKFSKIGLVINGSLSERVANNVNVSIPNIDAEFLVLQLDAKGIACSTKSSCLRDEDESYVLRALGKSVELSKNAIRFSMGRSTTKKDLEYTLSILEKYVHPLAR